jgi:hypothetical protein
MKTIRKIVIILFHALVGWGVCGAIIFIGRSITSMKITLIIHAIAVPIVFGLITWLYFSKFAYTTPLQTAAIFLGIVIFMDGGIIAPFVEKSFAMFTSPDSFLGTWIPFFLIFMTTFIVGSMVVRKPSLFAKNRS